MVRVMLSRIADDRPMMPFDAVELVAIDAMPADIGAFDLVIVDEASQSDLWALPAIVRGKKILVVGDDKQVSPVPLQEAILLGPLGSSG
jgi:superfamily I DNA and/or RNA helicase